jgi:hypothetical protein
VRVNWTRRKFVATSAGAALVTHIKPAAAASTGLDAATEKRLREVMDEIIPRQANMPSASEAGGVAYFAGLKQAEPELAAVILESLNKVPHSSPLVDALKQFEQNDLAHFEILRDFVYEAYYTQPQIWKLIGYEFYPTDRKGPHMKPFDEAVIANVRKKPKYYREA